MAFIRIVARLINNSAMPEDDAINVWHFDSDQTFAEDADDTVNRLKVFYTDIDEFLGSQFGNDPMRFDVYNLSDPPPRVPALITTQALTLGTNQMLPEEVAVVLSMSAAEVSGQPQRRRRGRVYIGPLDSGVVAVSGGHARVHADFRTALANAAAALAHGPDVGDARLAVFSPTTAGLPEPAGGWSDAQLDAAFHDVTFGWIDNAFDTQRRRGPAPTTRTNWTPA